jgi:hypothetical protein
VKNAFPNFVTQWIVFLFFTYFIVHLFTKEVYLIIAAIQFMLVLPAFSISQNLLTFLILLLFYFHTFLPIFAEQLSYSIFTTQHLLFCFIH